MADTQSTHTSPHALYRFFDATGALLYVGITLNPGARWKQHSKDKPWWGTVANVTVEQFPDRATVLEAERTAIISEKPRHNVVHNRGNGSTVGVGTDDGPLENLWTFTTRRGYERTTDLHLAWEVNGTPVSDNWLPDEIDAHELMQLWMNTYGRERYVPIYWSVWPVHETAPMQSRRIFADGDDFLSYHSWPVHARTRQPLNWNTLPVLDGAWTPADGTKGGFFQQVTGWKPAPLQPYVDLHQVLAAAGLRCFDPSLEATA